MIRLSIQHFDVVDSTQIRARALVDEKRSETAYKVISADQQTAGYGRRGRTWESPSGNLSATTILPYKQELLGLLPYMVGIALYNATASCLQSEALLRLKWPNDVMLDGKKLSGVLLEIYQDFFLIGTGVNLAFAPETDQPTVALNDYSQQPIKAEEFLRSYLLQLQALLPLDPTEILSQWLQRSQLQPGDAATAKLMDGSVINGAFASLDEHGRMMLVNDAGNHAISVADIFLQSNTL